MKTAISLPDEVFRAAERVAKRKGMSRSEFYARAIVALLRQEDDEAVTAQLNRVYAGADASLDPALQALPAGVVEREDW